MVRELISWQCVGRESFLRQGERRLAGETLRIPANPQDDSHFFGKQRLYSRLDKAHPTMQ